MIEALQSTLLPAIGFQPSPPTLSARASLIAMMDGAITNPVMVREMILRLEQAMREDGRFDPLCGDFPVRHFKAPGMIGRQMLIPQFGLIIGKIHKHAHLNQISFGHVRVMTEFGPMEIRGPHTFTSEPGTKRVVVALENTLWTTFHLNPNNYDPENEADMKLLESEIIAKSYDEFEALAAPKNLMLEAA
jgi:hypothetical protein